MSTLPRVEAGPCVLSEDRMYRYTLTRVWAEHKPRVAFIGLNPSTADESNLDPTLRRCLGFADSWGYGSLVMLNLFAFRATDPVVMRRAREPVGEIVNGQQMNDVHLVNECRASEMVVACWGGRGHFKNRATEVRRLLAAELVPLHYLKLTVTGQPWHPLYLSSDLKPVRWVT